jgi:hypothetical protein
MIGAVALAAGAAAGSGCVGERERLDVPRLTVEVINSTVTPGGVIVGSAAATDASGLEFVAVYACTRDSIFLNSRQVYNRARSAEFPFELPVSSASAEGDSVVVYGFASDTQGFDAETVSVVFIRGSSTTIRPEGDALRRCLPDDQARNAELHRRRGTITSPDP